MPDDPPNDQSPPPPRRRTLTPEQRRFLGTPRAREEESEVPRESARPQRTPPPRGEEEVPSRDDEPEPEREERITRGTLRLDPKASRAPEMQRAFLIIGALFLLGVTFFVGYKFPYWRHQIMSSRNVPNMDGTVANKFPGLAVEELIEQALKLEREGKFQEAAERLLAAKHRNLNFRGILFRVGKIAYDQRDYETADKLFERAIAFGENVDSANYYRGLIAVRRKDLPAALRFFEAAAAAEPFVANHHFYIGEVLRLDHRPREAIPHYEHAALLASDKQQATICHFKIRLALLEAADASPVKAELEAQKKLGRLSAAWLLTAAAIDLREGRVDDAIPLIRLAHAAGDPEVYASCITDTYFIVAARKHPQVAEVVGTPAG